MKLYINIGNERACLFVFLSRRLLNELSRHPLLYDAVEEALISAKNGYFSIGILVWHQLLKVLSANKKTDAQPRNLVAHDILRIRPTRDVYDGLLKRLKEEANNCYEKELAKSNNLDVYRSELTNDWQEFIISHGAPSSADCEPI